MSIAAGLHADQARRPAPAGTNELRIPIGPLLSDPLHVTEGAQGQPLAIHRHAYRTTQPDDAAWTAHGYAWLCHTCHTVGGAHDQYTPTLHSAEAHVCPKGATR